MTRYWIALILTLGCAHAAQSAGPFDGSKSMICSVDDVADCGEGGMCTRGNASDVNLPALARVDVKSKKITAASGNLPNGGEGVPIESVQREGGKLVLQGGQAGRGWTMVISETSGKSTFAVADEGYALLAFGACAAL
jgi:hypothetical protein